MKVGSEILDFFFFDLILLTLMDMSVLIIPVVLFVDFSDPVLEIEGIRAVAQRLARIPWLIVRV